MSPTTNSIFEQTNHLTLTGLVIYLETGKRGRQNMLEQSNDPNVPSRNCSDWAEIVKCLERLVALEFRSRARMHLNAALIPDQKDEFTWLTQMQHYGIPTRLLDFTYSPFAALYFAIREQKNAGDRSKSGLSSEKKVRRKGRRRFSSEW